MRMLLLACCYLNVQILKQNKTRGTPALPSLFREAQLAQAHTSESVLSVFLTIIFHRRDHVSGSTVGSRGAAHHKYPTMRENRRKLIRSCGRRDARRERERERQQR